MASLRKAANDKCKDCIYDKSVSGTWRDQVEACACTDCPLWPHRPLSGASIKAKRAAASGKVIQVTLAQEEPATA